MSQYLQKILEIKLLDFTCKRKYDKNKPKRHLNKFQFSADMRRQNSRIKLITFK